MAKRRVGRRTPQSINGDHILYHYLQKDLFESDIWLFQMLSARLVASLGIWFHPSVYQRLPVMLPFVVRDPSCRRRKEGEVEEWGAPDERGNLRDDNSLVKALPRVLTVDSTAQELYSGKRCGKGFVASHVWRQVRNSSVGAELASRDPILNTFVPNLVWLPSQVAKLTDREGTFTQMYLQALAAKIYLHFPVCEPLKPFVTRAWGMLTIPTGIPEQGLPETKDLSFFAPDERFFSERRKKIQEVVDALEALVGGKALDSKVITTRYGAGLPGLPRDVLRGRSAELATYLAAIDAAERDEAQLLLH